MDKLGYTVSRVDENCIGAISEMGGSWSSSETWLIVDLERLRCCVRLGMVQAGQAFLCSGEPRRKAGKRPSRDVMCSSLTGLRNL